MSAADANNFLQTDFIVPPDPSEGLVMVRTYLNQIATAVNTKDSGYYNANQTVTGQQFVPTFDPSRSANAQYRDVVRLVVDTGALPNTATKSVAHGITFTANMVATRIYGAATNPNTAWIPLPYASPVLANNIELNLDATNVNITTGSNRTSFTTSYVVIEFVGTS